MNILIIGSQGFIGSNAVDYFLNAGHSVIGCDISTTVSQNYYTIHNPVADFDHIFSISRFDVCINASGLANVQLSFQQPLLDYELNVSNVFYLLNALQKHNPTCKFINFSSAAVYGNPQKLPISESAFSFPLSPYGKHKKYSEEICKEFNQFFNIPTCSLRVFSAYGPGLAKQLFWDLYQKQKVSDVINLFGTGKETRDFIYITDLLYAVDCVIDKARFEGEAINFGNGEEESIELVAKYFLSHFGLNKRLLFTGEQKIGDPHNWKADIMLLKSMGYKKSTDIKEGINSYALWLKEKK